MKQYKYNMQNISKNYISSYANMVLRDNRLIFINTLNNRQLILCGENDSLEQLFVSLKKGITDEELKTLLTVYNIKNLMEILLAEGMVE